MSLTLKSSSSKPSCTSGAGGIGEKIYLHFSSLDCSQSIFLIVLKLHDGALPYGMGDKGAVLALPKYLQDLQVLGPKQLSKYLTSNY